MRRTTIREFAKASLYNPVLIEGLPGLGMVGKIAVNYMIKQLQARKFAELYSPHFPYHVVVNKRGGIRLLRAEIYYWKSQGRGCDLILITGDSQAQTIDGQYEVASSILDFAEKYEVKRIITIGGYRSEDETPGVFCASNSEDFFKDALRAGAKPTPPGSPIVGLAGLLPGLTAFRGMEGLCILGKTKGYLPDPEAAKSVLEVIVRLLGIPLELKGLDKEIEKAKRLEGNLRGIEANRALRSTKIRKEEERRTSYIS